MSSNFSFVEDDLLGSFRKYLQKAGTFEQFKNQLLRASLTSSILPRIPSKKIPSDVVIEKRFMNDLIREYLIWNGYDFANHVLIAESRQMLTEIPSREYLAVKLGVVDDRCTVRTPLLCNIVAAFMQAKEQK